MRAAGIANQLGWTGDRVTLRCEGLHVDVWMVVDEDEHHRRGTRGAVASLQELHRLLGSEANAGWSPAPPARIVGVACGPAPWRSAASAVGGFLTVAPRVVALGDDDAADDIVRTEARMWGIGVVVGDEVADWPAEPRVEVGVYQRWLAEECYRVWLRASPTLRSVP